MVSSRDPLQQLEAQRAYFASGDHIRDEVAIWADTTPEERLRELDAMSADNEAMLARIDDEALARMRELRAQTPDAEAILVHLRRAR